MGTYIGKEQICDRILRFDAYAAERDGGHRILHRALYVAMRFPNSAVVRRDRRKHFLVVLPGGDRLLFPKAAVDRLVADHDLYVHTYDEEFEPEVYLSESLHYQWMTGSEHIRASIEKIVERCV